MRRSKHSGATPFRVSAAELRRLIEQKEDEIDARAIQEALEELKAGRTISLRELEAELADS